MAKRLLAVLLLTAAVPAFAQRGPCGGFFSAPYVGQPEADYLPGVVVVDPGSTGGGVHGASGGGGGGGGLGNINDAYGFLIVVVITAAALPLVLYAVDDPSSADVMRCWSSPYEHLQFYGGGIGTSAGTLGYVGVRGGAAMGPIGLDVSAESAPFIYQDVMAALTLRAPPRQHVELGLAFGYRLVVDRAYALNYLEIALPHRYLPFRTSAGNPGVGLQVRPAFLLAPGRAMDARIDLSLEIPLGPYAQASIGGRFYSLDTQVRAAAQLGLSLGL